MAAENQNDKFFAGNTRVLAFTLTESDQAGAAALNLTGASVRWAMAPIGLMGAVSNAVAVRKTNGNGIVVTDPVAGLVEVTLEVPDTASLSGAFYHELEIVDAQGRAVVVATGQITILRNLPNA